MLAPDLVVVVRGRIFVRKVDPEADIRYATCAFPASLPCAPHEVVREDVVHERHERKHDTSRDFTALYRDDVCGMLAIYGLAQSRATDKRGRRSHSRHPLTLLAQMRVSSFNDDHISRYLDARLKAASRKKRCLC